MMNEESCISQSFNSLAMQGVEPNKHSLMGGCRLARQEESGEVQVVLPKRWSLVFEGFPLWCLALNKFNTAKVVIQDWNNLIEFEDFLKSQTSLFSLPIFHSLSMNLIDFGKDLVTDYVLCSGSLSFLKLQTKSLTGKGLFLLNSP